jgi:integrase
MATPKVSLRAKHSGGKTVYCLDYRFNGKRFRPSLGTNKRDAELVRAKVERDILLGTFQIAPTNKSISLKGLVGEFLDSKKNVVRKSSSHRYKNYLEPLCKYFDESFPAVTSDIKLIDTKYIRKFIDDTLQSAKWSKRTANDAINIIRSLFKFAIDSEYLTKNPAAQLQMLRIASTGKADFFTDQELEAIWSKLTPHWVDPLKFISLTGLRKAELINLRWEKVDLTPGKEQIIIESCDDWETKTGNSRIVPLHKEAVEIINRWKGKHAIYVFTSPQNRIIHPDRIYQALKTCLAELSLDGDVHKLRHTFASKLAMSGVELVTIKELLGHTDLKTTQIYAHVSPKHVRDAVNKIAFANDAAGVETTN